MACALRRPALMSSQALPATVDRVPESTSDKVNDRIRRTTERNVARAARGGAGHIDRRLRELGREWDIERTLESNAATVSLVGLGLGALVHRTFYALPA